MLYFLKKERVPIILLIGALLLTFKAFKTEKPQRSAPAAPVIQTFSYTKPSPTAKYKTQNPDQERLSTRRDFK